MKQENNNYNGINYLHILTLIFVVLKLCGVINWKWIFIIMPSLISIGLTILIIAIILIIAVITKKM